MKQTLRPTETIRMRTLAEPPAASRGSVQLPAGSAQLPEDQDTSLRSDALLQGRSHVSIAHNGQTYQLRATRLGKLILTK
jgi:hemin uptake protein HemP